MHKFQVRLYTDNTVWLRVRDPQASNLALNNLNTVLLKHAWLGKPFINTPVAFYSITELVLMKRF